MGCVMSQERITASKRSKDIDKTLKNDRLLNSKIRRILMFSTDLELRTMIMNQLKLINEQKSRESLNRVDGVIYGTFSFPYELIDISSIRSNTAKWIHIFDAIKLFGSFVNLKWFVETNFVVILSNCEAFEEKLKHTPLTVCFPEYDKAQDYKDASAFVQSQFELLNRSAKREVYCHLIRGKNVQEILSFVYDAITDIIISNNLKGCGLY
ncbi:6G79-A Chain A, Coupling specificity of heterotrimeric Go to the serotonin 5-HT1B receptor [Aphelenchoides besseyi]|nr:6G79-A Chain A, Coupling specificity of heterotrimeric Go to the serotonin 5-HT1B receptor [Aphelenchoides besseyi]